MLLLPIGLAGCTALGGESAESSQTAATVKPAVAPDGLAAMLSDYDRRNNEAILATQRTQDPTRWATADAGPLLDVDYWDTRWAALVKTDNKAQTVPEPMAHTGLTVYSGPAVAGPDRVIVELTSGLAGAKGPTPRLAVFSRESATSGWKQHSSATLLKTVRPPLPAAADAALPTAAQRTAVAAVAERLRKEVAVRPATSILPQEIGQALRRGAKKVTISITASYKKGGDQFGPAGAITARRTATGTLAVVAFRCKVTFTYPGGVIVWDPEIAAVLNQPGQQDKGTRFYLTTLAVHVPDKGAPTLVGWEVDPSV